MTIKTGLRNPLDPAQVRKAVLALETFVAKQKAALPKTPLVDSPEYVSAIITRKLIPAKGSNKPIQIAIPHSIRANDAVEMCLIVKTGDKARIKAALAAEPVPGLTKIIELKKLQKSFARFADKRTLADAYELFLADDRIVAHLPAALGTKFFVKAKQPLVVRVSRQHVAASIQRAIAQTHMIVRTGVCTNVKVAHLGMATDEIVENVLVAMNNCAAHIPKRWLGIQSISLKTNDSVALPIFNALATLSKLPPIAKREALQKRKIDELADVATSDAVVPVKRAKKDSETTTASAAPTTTDKKLRPKKQEAAVEAPKSETPVAAKKTPTPTAKKTKKPVEKAPAAATTMRSTKSKATKKKTTTTQ